jgi:superfamily II DNA or RNA helicase
VLKIGLQRLYPNQRRALAAVNKFLGKEKVKFAALIQMPTGTGKSGVIAMACTLFPRYRSALVLTPSDILCDQIKSNIERGFWEDDLGIENPCPKECVRFTPTNLKLLPSATQTVYISTMAVRTMHEANAQRVLNSSDAEDLRGHSLFGGESSWRRTTGL